MDSAAVAAGNRAIFSAHRILAKHRDKNNSLKRSAGAYERSGESAAAARKI